MPQGDYYVRVFVDGKPVPTPNHCGDTEGRDHKCRFRVNGLQSLNLKMLTCASRKFFRQVEIESLIRVFCNDHKFTLGLLTNVMWWI